MIAKIRYWIIPLAIVVSGGAIMAALIATREEPPRREIQPRPRLVSTVVVQPGPLAPEITAYGRVTSARPVQLISEVAGVLMPGEVPFKPAQPFGKGDLLVKVDDRQIRLQLSAKKAELLTALAQLLPELKIEYPAEYEKWLAYFGQCEFDRTLPELPEPANEKIKLFLARFNVYKFYFDVRDLEIRLDKHYFRAPFDGSIVSTDLRVGSTARLGAMLGEIISLEDLEVEVSLPVEELPWVNHRQPIRFSSREIGGEWQGRVSRVGSDIDARTQTVPVYVSLDGAPSSGLINGSFLTSTFPGRIIDSAVAVPRSAVYQDRFVYLVTEGKLEPRDIRIAFQQADQVIVSGGLMPGDTLVTEILQGVFPGMPAQSRVARAEP